MKNPASTPLDRRQFLRRTSLFAGGLLAGSAKGFAAEETKSPFKISLAQWSNHVALKAGEMDNLDWPKYTVDNFGIRALEWVNQFFYDKVGDAVYLAEMKKRTDDLGVTNVLIMCDRVGNIGNPDAWKAQQERWSDGVYQEDETGIYYDRYKGIADLMPLAKGVSAKSNDFNEKGQETHTNFTRAMRLVKKSSYTGYVGIEYEGSELSEHDGIKATKALLEKIFKRIEKPAKEKKAAA